MNRNSKLGNLNKVLFLRKTRNAQTIVFLNNPIYSINNFSAFADYGNSYFFFLFENASKYSIFCLLKIKGFGLNVLIESFS
jgi:hypothetical protein